MIICINCGVGIDDSLAVCPLCGKDPSVAGRQETSSYNYPSEIIQLHRREVRKSFWELSGIIAFSAVAVCTLVDLIIQKGLSWSLIADVFILGAWITLTLFLFAYRRPMIIIPGLILNALAALFVIDSIVPAESWFVPVGLPLTLAASASAGIIILLYRAANLKGLNIVAVAFVVLSGFCILTEMILDAYLKDLVILRWSLIAAISIIPVSLILLYFHYRLKKGNFLDSYLHI